MVCQNDRIAYDQEDGQEKPTCVCRHDMEFDTGNMECRLLLDVDCRIVEKIELESLPVTSPLSQIVQYLNQTGPVDQTFDIELATTAFCNLIDRYIQQIK